MCKKHQIYYISQTNYSFLLVLDYQSYLDYPRINFAGIIEADVSTMQNFMDNYEASVDPLLRPHNLSSNPKGSGVWRLRKAHVTSAFIKKRQEKICSINDNMDKVVHAVVKGVFMYILFEE